jgi:thiamine biosynthesis lipoprotein
MMRLLRPPFAILCFAVGPGWPSRRAVPATRKPAVAAPCKIRAETSGKLADVSIVYPNFRRKIDGLRQNYRVPPWLRLKTTMRPPSESAHDASRLRIAMGTTIAIDAEASTAHDALAGIEAAFAAIAQVEALMHPTRSGSDLSAIHRGGLGLPVGIHSWTWEVLALSRRLHQLSKGAFDPCLPDSAGRIADLEFPAPRSVIPHRPLRIDLGGIAKGYAVDRALMALRSTGCHGGLVNAGGDLAVFGNRSHSIVVRGPGARGSVIEIKNAALATSDVCSATRPAEHRGYYHGVNRREIRSGRVTVSAARAAIADALTKCLLADDGETSAALLETFNARLVAEDIHHE